eukprot:SAG31_NODE_6419_length_2027_cov_1.037344_2_plen_295_part_00
MINSVLREQFGFSVRPENYVVTDSGALDFMMSRFHRYTKNESQKVAAAAMNAGVDLNSGSVYLKLEQALSEGLVQIAQIDTALARLFHARMSVGLFDDPSTVVYSKLGNETILSAPHVRAALKVATQSLVLLKNEPVGKSTAPNNQDGMRSVKPLLPLDAKTIRRIAVIGWGANDTYVPLANYMGCGYDSWSPRIQNCSIITPLAGIQQVFEPDGVDVTFAHGCDVESNSTSGFADAVAAAKAADVVVYVGGNRNCEGGQGKGGAHCESEGHGGFILHMHSTKVSSPLADSANA